MLETTEEKIMICGGFVPGSWHFYGTRFFTNKLQKYSNVCCSRCKEYKLDPGYVYIITQLKQKGLLDVNYPYLCCKCFINDRLKQAGLICQ